MSLVARISPILGILSVSLWGVSFSAGKIAYEQLELFELNFMRMLLSALCVLPILIFDIYKNGLPNKKDFGLLFIVGFTAYVATLTFQFMGLQYVDASVASIAVGLEGTFTMIIAYMYLKQKPVKSNYWVAILSLIGLIVVVGMPESAKLMGVFFIMMANIFAGISIVLQKPLFKNVSVNGMLGWTIVFGFVSFLLASPIYGLPDVTVYTTKTWGALLVLSIGATVIAYLLYTICLKYLSATRTAQFIVIEPVVGVLTATSLLGEPFTMNIVIGTTLVVVAMLINSVIDDGN
ncbi:MAG: DMT family transporter [Alphaproteobacteria bacterium]